MNIFFIDSKTYDALEKSTGFEPKLPKEVASNIDIIILTFKDFIENKESKTITLDLVKNKMKNLHFIEKCDNLLILAYNLNYNEFVEISTSLWQLLIYNEENLKNVFFVATDLLLGDFALHFQNTMYVTPLVTNEKYFAKIFKEQKKQIFKNRSYLIYKFQNTLIFRICKKMRKVIIKIKRKIQGKG